MPAPSQEDKAKLQKCHPDIRTVGLVVLRKRNGVIAHGYRGRELQNRLYDEGKSKLKYPESKHNFTKDGKPYSKAMDIYPTVDGSVPWGEDRYFYFFGGYVLATASQLGIDLRWGGDWDSDFDFSDQTFNDLGHFELT